MRLSVFDITKKGGSDCCVVSWKVIMAHNCQTCVWVTLVLGVREFLRGASFLCNVVIDERKTRVYNRITKSVF